MKLKKVMSVLLTLMMVVAGMNFVPRMNETVSAAATGVAAPRTNYGTCETISVWDCVYLGSYPQSSDGNGGYVTEPIKWRVLSVEGNTAFVIADMNLDSKPYNTTNADVTWEISTIRSWLNGYDATYNSNGVDYTSDNFINTAFTPNERQAILDSEVIADNNPSQGTSGGNNTVDKVYLMSRTEAANLAYGLHNNSYDIRNNTKTAKNTAYATSRGAYSYDNNGYWRLRTPGYYSNQSICIEYNGNESYYGVQYSNYGIRPCMHIDLTSSYVTEAGTVQSHKDQAPGSYTCNMVDNNVVITWEGYDSAKLYVDGTYYNTYSGSISIPKSTFSQENHSFAIAGVTQDTFGESEMTDAVTLKYDGWKVVPGQTVSYGSGGIPRPVNVGVWQLWDTDTSISYYGQATNYNGAMSYIGNGATCQDLTVRIDEPVIFTHSYGSSILGMRTYLDLENEETYQYTVKFTSTQPGSATISWEIFNGSESMNNPNYNCEIVAGQNVLKGFFKVQHQYEGNTGFIFAPSDGTSCLPAGTQINFTELSCTKLEDVEDEVFEGQCGQNVYWTLNKTTGLLNITGSGAMDNYSRGGSPWYPLCEYIQSINISDNITGIGNYAFYGCNNATNVTVSEDVTRIGSYAFNGCTGLTEIVIPGNLTSLESGIFSGCTNLTEFIIPNSVQSIGSYAFDDCTSLEEIIIPNNVTSIGWVAFADCTSLESVTIGNSVTSLGSSIFSRCTSLTQVIIPESVESIDFYAFYGCDNMTDVYIYNENCSISSDEQTIPANITIHGYANSTAQTYATNHNRTFVEIGDEEPTIEEPTTEEPADPNFVISKKQLALTNGLRFYLKADKTLFTESEYTNPTMVIEFNNGQTVVSEYVEEAQYYAFPFNDIAPHQMGYTFSATLHAYKNGKEYVSPALEYSVAQYCYDVFDAYKQYSYNQYAKLYTLLVDLLNYGAQAQLYTNTDTDNLVNSDLTAEQQSHATTLSGDFVNSRNYNYETIANPSVTWQAAALNLRDSIVMRLRFAAASTDGLVVKARDDKGNEWEIDAEAFESAGSGTYNVYFDQFNVGRMSDIVYLTVYNGDTPVSNTCSFSIESYAAVIQQNASTYPDLAALTTAMMKYGKSAKAYTS